MSVFYTKRMSEKSKNNSTGLVLAVSVLCMILVFIVYLVKRDTIYTNLKTTHFFERIFGVTPEFIANHQVTDEKNVLKETSVKSDQSKALEPVIEENKELVIEEEEPIMIQVTVSDEITVENKSDNSAEVDKNIYKDDVKASQPKTSDKTDSASQTSKTPVVSEKPHMNAKLYFVVIDKDGSITKKVITRSIEKNDSPLTTNIKLLLAGPIKGEKAASLIPPGTKLLGARVSDGVAYLNFNDAFEFNPKGVEGSINQLMQIVYTATEFNTVKTVQFLIDGQKKEYLGSEGVWIGTPLSRSSF